MSAGRTCRAYAGPSGSKRGRLLRRKAGCPQGTGKTEALKRERRADREFHADIFEARAGDGRSYGRTVRLCHGCFFKKEAGEDVRPLPLVLSIHTSELGPH